MVARRPAMHGGGALSMWGSSVGAGSREGRSREGCSSGGSSLGGSSKEGGGIRTGCTGGEGNGTRACAVKELEGAGGSWEPMLLAALLQLVKMLTLRAGGAAADAWRHTRGRWRVRQGM